MVESLKAKYLEEFQALDIKEESQMLSDMDIAKKFKLKDLFEQKIREGDKMETEIEMLVAQRRGQEHQVLPQHGYHKNEGKHN